MQQNHWIKDAERIRNSAIADYQVQQSTEIPDWEVPDPLFDFSSAKTMRTAEQSATSDQ